MQARGALVYAITATACAAVAIGCTHRTLEPQGSGTGGVGPAAAGHEGGGGAGGGAGAGKGGASVAVGGGGGIIPPGDPEKNGEACTSGPDCASGFCADGFCCDSDCADGCRRCDAPGTVGTCVALPVNTVCGAGACDGDAIVGQMVCDGRGNCRAGSTTICVPYRCDPATAACMTTCATDADCGGTTYCQTDGHCHIGGGGPPCPNDSVCASGFCWRGTCCNARCDDPCMACDLPNHEGTCWSRPDGCPDADAMGD